MTDLKRQKIDSMVELDQQPKESCVLCEDKYKEDFESCVVVEDSDSDDWYWQDISTNCCPNCGRLLGAEE